MVKNRDTYYGERIAYKDQKDNFKLIANKSNRLSEYSKFFKYNGKIYESFNLGKYYNGWNVHLLEIIDKKKIKSLNKKFAKKEAIKNEEIKKLLVLINEQSINLDILFSRHILDYEEKGKCGCWISVSKVESVSLLHEKHKSLLGERYKSDLKYIYNSRQKVVGFFHGTICDSYVQGSTYVVDESVFNKSLDLYGIEKNANRKWYKKVNSSSAKIDALKNQLDEKTLEITRSRDELSECQKDATELLKKNRILTKNNQELSNKYSRFEIMEFY